MSRRSSRLLSGGYYNSDEESDSSSVTNITYRENPVKVFKKKAGTRKAASRTSSRANSNASSPSRDPSPLTAEQCDVLSPSPSNTRPEPIMRTTPYVFTSVTPRPALTPSSSRGQTPTRCPSLPPEQTPSYSGLHGCSRAGLHLRPGHKEPGHSGVDSSGYSSSEGVYRKPLVSTRASEAPENSCGSRISSALYRLMDSASSMAAAAQSKVSHLTVLAKSSVSSRMKKTCGLILLLLLLLLCLWLLLPVFISIFPRTSVSPSQTKPQSPPVVPTATSPPSSPPPSSSPPSPPPPLPPQPDIVPHPAPVVDPAVVSAVVEEKMKILSAELLMKQEQLFSQMRESMKQHVNVDMQEIKAHLESLKSDTRRRLEQEVAELNRKMAAHQSDGASAAAGLSRRIQTVEAENLKLSQDLSSIQLAPPPPPPPPPAPCPEVNSDPPVQDQLTPDLQEAMEKWFTDRIKEYETLRLGDKGGCADCGRPLADKMADFALETQGASVVSTRCSETYRIRSACVTLFGFPLWYPSESPRTVIQGYPVLLPGKCWAFHGVQGTLVISLSHPLRISHVTLDHLPRCNSPTGRIDSAPKDFEVYGMKNDTEEGTLLGTFTYDQDAESTQTFALPKPSDEVHRYVELRVLSNWGHMDYTCLYRFRVHGKMAAT